MKRLRKDGGITKMPMVDIQVKRPVLDVLRIPPTITSNELHMGLEALAIDTPLNYSTHSTAITEVRPDVMWPLRRYMNLRFIEVHTRSKPRECQRNVDQPEIWTLNVVTSCIAPSKSLLEVDHTVETLCATKQLEQNTEEAEHLNVLESYYFDFIQAKVMTERQSTKKGPILHIYIHEVVYQLDWNV